MCGAVSIIVKASFLAWTWIDRIEWLPLILNFLISTWNGDILYLMRFQAFCELVKDPGRLLSSALNVGWLGTVSGHHLFLPAQATFLFRMISYGVPGMAASPACP